MKNCIFAFPVDPEVKSYAPVTTRIALFYRNVNVIDYCDTVLRISYL